MYARLVRIVMSGEEVEGAEGWMRGALNRYGQDYWRKLKDHTSRWWEHRHQPRHRLGDSSITSLLGTLGLGKLSLKDTPCGPEETLDKYDTYCGCGL